MKTPDGKEFEPGLSGTPLAAAGRAAQDIMRWCWRAIVALARAAGKFVATVWRLAGALDAALWRGVKLAARQTWRGISAAGGLFAAALEDFFNWLPSPAGRAYSALFAFLLVLMCLWVVDQLRARPVASEAGGQHARAPVDEDDPILARVDGRYVHLSEVAAAASASGALRDAETLTPESAFKRQLVQSYIDQKLLAKAASDEGLQRDPAVARRISASRDRILAAAFLEDRISVAATDEAVEGLYARQADVTRLGDAVRARQIVVATKEEAERAVERLTAGEDFAALARELSLDRSTATLGGEMDYFTRDMMTPALASVAFSTSPGERAAPFETEFGWHVIEVLDRRPTSGVSLAAVREDIRRYLRQRTISSTLGALKEASDVVYYSPPNAGEDARAD